MTVCRLGAAEPIHGAAAPPPHPVLQAPQAALYKQVSTQPSHIHTTKTLQLHKSTSTATISSQPPELNAVGGTCGDGRVVCSCSSSATHRRRAGLDIITALIRRVAQHCLFNHCQELKACPAINMPHAPRPHILGCCHTLPDACLGDRKRFCLKNLLDFSG